MAEAFLGKYKEHRQMGIFVYVHHWGIQSTLLFRQLGFYHCKTITTLTKIKPQHIGKEYVTAIEKDTEKKKKRERVTLV